LRLQSSLQHLSVSHQVQLSELKDEEVASFHQVQGSNLKHRQEKLHQVQVSRLKDEEAAFHQLQRLGLKDRLEKPHQVQGTNLKDGSHSALGSCSSARPVRRRETCPG